MDCESGFKPLSLGTSTWLLSSPNFLPNGCEPRGTPARRDFLSRGWSMFVQMISQVRVKVLSRKRLKARETSCRSSYAVSGTDVRMPSQMKVEDEGQRLIASLKS